MEELKILFSGNGLTLYHTISTSNDLMRKRPFENVVGKGENAGNQHFLLFQHVSYPSHIKFQFFNSQLFCHLEILSILTSLKFCHSVKS